MELVTSVERGGGAADRLMLLLHGRGADETDLAALVPYLVPRAPLAAPPGHQWYESGGLPRPDPETFLPSLDAVDDLLDAACVEHGLQRAEAVLAGFSQGAALVLALGLRRSGRAHPAGILAMSGFLPDVPGLDYDWDAELPPVLVQHGTHDPLIPVYWGRGVAEALASHDVPVVFGEYPMQHQVALESLEQARGWLAQVLRGERPSEPVGEAVAPPVDDGPVKTVTAATFEQDVLHSDLPVIVDFWAEWCQPCRAVSPVIEQMARMREGSYRFAKVNIDENPQIAQAYQVQSIPMIALFRNGRLERSSLGAKPRQQLEAELGMLVIP